MITKGIVEEIVTQYKVKVRAPILDKISSVGLSTSSYKLSEAIICSLPNCDINLRVGDVVFIAFEDNDYSKPIVIGMLYRSAQSETYCDLILSTLKVNSEVLLPTTTSIGDVEASNIQCLRGARSNLQDQLDNITDKLNYIMDKLN